MDRSDPVSEERPGKEDYSNAHRKKKVFSSSDLMFKKGTYDHPCLRSASWRSCRCVCGKCGLWASPPSLARKASFLEQRASLQEGRSSGRAAARNYWSPPAVRAPLVGQGSLLWLFSTLAPEAYKIVTHFKTRAICDYPPFGKANVDSNSKWSH